MAIIYECFTCGSDQHLKADCPDRTSRAKTPPDPRPEAGSGEREIKTSVHCLTCGVRTDSAEGVRHHPACGATPSTPERFGAILGAAGVDRTAVVRTEFRTSARMMPRTEAQLRELAARQVAESRAAPRPFDGKERTEEEAAAS